MKKWTLYLQPLFMSVLHWIGDFRLNAKTKKQNLKLKSYGREQLRNHFARQLKGLWHEGAKLPRAQTPDMLGWLGATRCLELGILVQLAVAPPSMTVLPWFLFFLSFFPPRNISRDCHFKVTYAVSVFLLFSPSPSVFFLGCDTVLGTSGAP